MRPFPRLLFPALCAAVTAAGCRDTTGPADGLRVTTALDLAEIRGGQVATVTTTVLNAGSRPRHVYGADVCFDGPFTLTRADGAAVRTALDPCYTLLIARAPAVLAPGQQLAFTGRLSGDARTAAASSLYTVVAPAGEYVLRGYVNAVGRDQILPVTGTPVSVRILP